MVIEVFDKKDHQSTTSQVYAPSMVFNTISAGYLQFNLLELKSTVKSATLKLFFLKPDKRVLIKYGGVNIYTLYSVEPMKYYEVDVTDWVNREGNYNFIVYCSTIRSLDLSNHEPELLLDY
jgi:hypothetical protein